MAILISEGVGNSLPWWRTVVITCGSCDAQYQLDEMDHPRQFDDAVPNPNPNAQNAPPQQMASHIVSNCPWCNHVNVIHEHMNLPQKDPAYRKPRIEEQGPQAGEIEVAPA